MTTSNGSRRFEHTENAGQFNSKCLNCGRTIATSPNQAWLGIAEAAHECHEPYRAPAREASGDEREMGQSSGSA